MSYGPTHAWEWLTLPARMGVLVALGAALAMAAVPPRCCAAFLLLALILLLNLLNQAFGFEGGPPAIAQGAQTLAAPQATLISALARGVIGGDLRWDLIGLGAVIGVVIIVLDAVLEKATNKRIKLPPLAVGIGF